MRIQVAFLSVAFLLNAGVIRAEDDPKAIVEKAIKAHGGAEKLMKYKASRMKGKGKVDTPVGELEFTQESAAMLPDKIKEVSEFEVMGQKVRTVTLINGDKASIEANGKEVPLKDEIKDAIREGVKQLQVARLVPLRDKKFELSLVGETKVLDKPAVTIRVVAKGMKDVNLSFDKKSGLLVKVEARKLDPMNGQEVTEERIVSEYKTQDGMAIPQKVLINRDGKKYLELTIEEVKYLDKIDDSEFSKP